MNNNEIRDAQNILTGRLFQLGGSVLFLVGSFIAAMVAYEELQKNINKTEKTPRT
ncbi:hypothetical protein P4573_13295 [Priestia megaterium]|uniref:hypothetical protein n=1 Tax=Priestia TaxID=2800373 RepID=UPI00177EE5AB|nr:hypothetical protein [Priestia megaterium]MBD8848512.1 hypothetical protein [Priestia megaterium]MCF6800137.1 hypothetical protein [Bacillus sp. ET1]MED3813214.1 hypothetical protein [Priestia megaterium]